MGEAPLSAFILSAGFGERLRPITESIPKPLLPIMGRPVLGHVLEKLTRLTFIGGGIAINTHHLSEAIERWLRGSEFRDKVRVFREGAVPPTILGTGGALKNAERFLSGGPFIVHNGDVFSEIDLGKLIEAHLSSGNTATLAVHDYTKFNSLVVDANGLLCDVKKASGGLRAPSILGQGAPSAGTSCHAFTGIAVYSPEFLKFLPPGPSSVVDAWLSAIKAGKRVGTYDVSGSYWADIGTPESYAETVVRALRTDGETVYFHPSLKGCPEMAGFVVVEEDCKLDSGTALRNCIVLPGTSLDAGAYENSIIGPDFVLRIPEPKMPYLIGSGGSDRKYYRAEKGAVPPATFALLEAPPHDPDFHRLLEYTKFFRRRGLPVPELLWEDPE